MAKVRLYHFSIQTDFSFSSIQILCVYGVIVKTLRLGYTRFQFRLTFHFHQYKHYVFVGLFYHEAITFACKDAIAKPSMTQDACSASANPKRFTEFLHSNLLRIFYHEAKMLACKGIFAKPSKRRTRVARRRIRSGFAKSCIARLLRILYHKTVKKSTPVREVSVRSSDF